MVLRDRGMVKWQAAFQLPELVKTQRDLWRDTQRVTKPNIDEQECEEFNERIAYAMEMNYPVKINVWEDGFLSDITGRIHYVDPLTKKFRLEVNPGEFDRINFEDIVGVTVVD